MLKEVGRSSFSYRRLKKMSTFVNFQISLAISFYTTAEQIRVRVGGLPRRMLDFTSISDRSSRLETNVLVEKKPLKLRAPCKIVTGKTLGHACLISQVYSRSEFGSRVPEPPVDTLCGRERCQRIGLRDFLFPWIVISIRYIFVVTRSCLNLRKAAHPEVCATKGIEIQRWSEDFSMADF